MPVGCLIVFTACTDPSREEEFNRWYSHTHLPDLLKTPGCVRARRFRETGENCSGRYLAQYEFESDDLQATHAALYRLALRAVELGRHIECIVGSAPDSYQSLWEEIHGNDLAPLEIEDRFQVDPAILAAIAADVPPDSSEA